MILNSSILICALVFCTLLALSNSKSKTKYLIISTAIVFVASLGAIVITHRYLLLPIWVLSTISLVLSIIAQRSLAKPKYRPWLSALAFVLVLVSLFPTFTLKPSVSFPEPTGEFPVGVNSGLVTDNARGNDWDAIHEAPRKLLLRVWYPAAMDTDVATSYRLTENEKRVVPVFSRSGFSLENLFLQALSEAKTNASWGASIAEGTFPVVLFSHGYRDRVMANTALMEELASHGYVVVSITHPGETNGLVYPSGEHVPISPNISRMNDEAALAFIEAMDHPDLGHRLKLYEKLVKSNYVYVNRIPVWVDDFTTVLNALEMNSGVSGGVVDILNSLNFSAVGYIGMSFGGTSGALACHRDPRCSAIVTLDSGGPHIDLVDSKIAVPALIISAGYTAKMGGIDLFYEPFSMHGSTSDVYRITFPTSGHLDFTDKSLVLTKLGKTIAPVIAPYVLGSVDGGQGISAQSNLAREFLDIYLKGEHGIGFPDSILSKSQVAEKHDPTQFRNWYEGQ